MADTELDFSRERQEVEKTGKALDAMLASINKLDRSSVSRIQTELDKLNAFGQNPAIKQALEGTITALDKLKASISGGINLSNLKSVQEALKGVGTEAASTVQQLNVRLAEISRAQTMAIKASVQEATRASKELYTDLGSMLVRNADLKGRTASKMTLDDTRALLGMPDRDAMKSFAVQLRAQMQEDMATAGLRTKSASKMTLADTRALLGLPDSSAIERLGAQLRSEAQAALRASADKPTFSPTDLNDMRYKEAMASMRNYYTELQTSVAKASPVVAAAAAATASNSKAASEATPKVTGLSKAFAGLAGDSNDLHSAARGLASGLNLLWLTWGNLVPLFAGAMFSFGAKNIVTFGASIDHTLSTVRVLSEESSTSINRLNDDLLTLGRSGPFGPLEIAEAMKTMSLAGLDAESVSRSVKDVLNFAVAGTTDIKTAADVMTSVATAFSMTANSYNYVGDVIAKTAAVSKSSIESIGEAFKTASVINKQYGVSLEDTGASLALLSNLGIQGSAAGTALRNTYVDLSGRTPKVTKVIKELGLELKDQNGNFKDLVTMVGELDTALSRHSSSKQKDILQTLASERGMKLLVEALDQYRHKAEETSSTVGNKLQELQDKIASAAGFMAISAVEMSQTSSNQMKAVWATLQTSMVESFDGMQPTVLAVSSQLRAMFNSPEFKEGLKDLITLVGGFASALANLAGFVVKHSELILGLAAGYVGLSSALRVAATAQAAFAATAAAEAAATTAGAAATAGRMATLTGLARLLPGLGQLVMAGTAAWMLYDATMGKASKTKETFANSSSVGDMIAQLDKETARIRENTQAILENVSAEELRLRGTGLGGGKSSAAAKVEQLESEISKMESQIARAKKIDPSYAPGPLNTQLTEKRAALEVAKETLTLEQKSWESAKQRAIDAAKAQQKATNDKLKADADNMRKLFGNLPFEVPSGKGSKGSGAAAHLVAVSNNMDLLEQQSQSRLSVIQAGYDKERKLLDTKHSNELISEGEYQASLLLLINSTEDKRLAELQRNNEELAAEYSRVALAEIAAYDKKISTLNQKAENHAENLAAYEAEKNQKLEALAQKYLTGYEKNSNEIAKIETERYLRLEEAAAKYAGEAVKAQKAVDDTFRNLTDEAAKREAVEGMARAWGMITDAVTHTAIAEKAAAVAGAQASSTIEALLRKEDEHIAKARTAISEFIALAQGTGALLQPDTIDRLRAMESELDKSLKRRESVEIRGAQYVASESARAYEKSMTDAMDRLKLDFSDAIMTSLLHGGEAGKKALRDILIKELERPIRLVVNVMVNAIGNILGLGGGAGGLGGTLGSSLLGNAASGLFGGLGAIGGAISGFGTAMTASIQSLLGITGTTSQMVASLTAAGHVAAPGMAAGSSFFNAIPGWGWALAGVAALASLLDKSGTPHGGGIAQYSAAGGLETSTTHGAFNTGFGGVEAVKAGQDIASNTAKGVAGLLDAAAKALGKKGGYEVATGFAGDGNDPFWGALRVALGGKDIINWNDASRTSKWAPKEFGSAEEYQAAVAKSITDYLITETPAWAATMLKALGDTPTLETLTETVSDIASVTAALDAMGRASKSFAGLSETAIGALLKSMGGAKAAVSSLEAYYNDYYTESERAAVTTAQLTKSFGDLGKSLPSSREALRAMIDAAIAAGDTDLAAKLIALAPAFSTISKSAEDIAKAAKEAADNAADKALEALRKSVNDQKAIIQTQLDAWQTLADEAKSIWSWLDSTIFDLRKTNIGPSANIAIGQQSLDAMIAAAVGQGIMPDQTALEQAVSLITSGIEAPGAFGNETDRRYASLVLAGKLETLKGVSEVQLTAAERSVALAKQQLTDLDKTLEFWQKQVDLAKGNIDATLSVAEAIANLQEALKPGSTGKGKSTGGSGSGSGGYYAPSGERVDLIEGVGGTAAQIYGAKVAGAIENARKNGNTMAAAEIWLNSTTGRGLGSADAAAKAAMAAGATADEIKRLEDLGKAYQDIQTATGHNPTAAELEAELKRRGIPAFARGGLHSGGWALVGEHGPELAYMPPARIFTHAESVAMQIPQEASSGFDTSSIVYELQSLRAENAQMREKLSKIEEHTGTTAGTLKDVTLGNALITQAAPV